MMEGTEGTAGKNEGDSGDTKSENEVKIWGKKPCMQFIHVTCTRAFREF